MASEKKIFEFFFSPKKNFAFRLPRPPIKISDLGAKFIWLVEDYSRNISVKLLSKYLE